MTDNVRRKAEYQIPVDGEWLEWLGFKDHGTEVGEVWEHETDPANDWVKVAVLGVTQDYILFDGRPVLALPNRGDVLQAMGLLRIPVKSMA